MRKHPNVLKAQRQRRQGRRAYLTSVYSLIKVPRRISNSHIPEEAHALFDYRARGGSPQFNPFLDALFPGITPKASDWNSEEIHKKYPEIVEFVGERNGRKFALDRVEQEKLITLITDKDVCDYVTLRESPIQAKRLTFVFNRQRDRCYFIEISYDATQSYCMKSKVYGGRERAMFDFEHNRISWHELLPLASLELVLPRRD